MNEMRVLHVASSYPLHPGDGTAPFMQEMLAALADRGHDVVVLVPRIEGLVEGRRSGVRVVGVPYAPQPLQVWGYGRSLDARNRLRFSAAAISPVALASLALAMRSEIRTRAPDLVHLHWALPQGALSMGVPLNIPVVTSIHGADARFTRGLLKPMARYVLDRADAVMAASSRVLDSFLTLDPRARGKSTVIPHGADSALFQPRDRSAAQVSLGIDPRFRVVLGVGRLVGKKGFDVLVDAFNYIPDPDFRLVIVGEGPERHQLEQLGDHQRVRLVGQLGRSEVALWLAASDVVAIPSVEFGLDIDSGPVVLMEALASGRPVVTTPIGMAPDIIENNVNGFLVEPGDPRALGEAILRAERSSERLGSSARRTFEEVGDWDRVAAELEQVYADAVANRAARIKG